MNVCCVYFNDVRIAGKTAAFAPETASVSVAEHPVGGTSVVPFSVFEPQMIWLAEPARCC